MCLTELHLLSNKRMLKEIMSYQQTHLSAFWGCHTSNHRTGSLWVLG